MTKKIKAFRFKTCGCDKVATFRFLIPGLSRPYYFCYEHGVEEIHVLAFDETCTTSFTLEVWPDGFLDDGRKVISLTPTVYDATSTKEAS